MGLFQKKMRTATLNVNARIRPDVRDELYEQPLDKILKEKRVGTVDGGGTMLSDDGMILNCDVEILYKPKKEETLIAIAKLTPLPKGSKLILDDGDREIALGALEGIGVYLNGTDLPAEVYASCDVNYVYEKLEELLRENLMLTGYAEGKTETALFFYGERFSEMKEKIEPFLQEYPLCQKCRVEQIA